MTCYPEYSLLFEIKVHSCKVVHEIANIGKYLWNGSWLWFKLFMVGLSALISFTSRLFFLYDSTEAHKSKHKREKNIQCSILFMDKWQNKCISPFHRLINYLWPIASISPTFNVNHSMMNWWNCRWFIQYFTAMKKSMKNRLQSICYMCGYVKWI
jgi:hypothetical protein